MWKGFVPRDADFFLHRNCSCQAVLKIEMHVWLKFDLDLQESDYKYWPINLFYISSALMSNLLATFTRVLAFLYYGYCVAKQLLQRGGFPTPMFLFLPESNRSSHQNMSWLATPPRQSSISYNPGKLSSMRTCFGPGLDRNGHQHFHGSTLP